MNIKFTLEGMMKRLWIPGMILLLALTFFMGFSTQEDMPPPEAKALWNYITKTSPYSEWGFWEDHKDMQPGNAPHGPFHKVYVNEILLKSTTAPVPYGSIQVKESYDKAKKKTAITVMYKVKDFNPDAGDWYWVKYSLDGKGGPAGKVQGCIGCHGIKAKNDYILVHDLTSHPAEDAR